MKNEKNMSRKSRRNFIKKIIIGSCLMNMSNLNALARENTGKKIEPVREMEYKYKTVSLKHYPEMQKFMDKLISDKKVSDHKIFQSYIEKKKFVPPEDFPEAKSVIVIATFTPLVYADFYLDGKKNEVMLPPQYYADGLTLKQLEGTIQKEIIKDPGYKIKSAGQIFLKNLAVRSGLGRYGKNNICYVDEFGSFITLFAYYTDREFEEDHFGDVKMLDVCQTCVFCQVNCPTGAIRKNEFVINAGKCVTLYNEIEGEFPEWIDPGAHNALMGCMRCQFKCPANMFAVGRTGRLEAITEEETKMILDGKPDEKTIRELARKLKKYYPASKDYFPIFTRNLKVLINS